MNREDLTLYSPNGDVTRLDDPEWDPPLSIHQRRWLDEGHVLRGGRTMSHAEEAKVKGLLTVVPRPQRSVVDPSAPEYAPRLYIPGLMSHGTSPGFVGPKGWGKTKFLCELCAALVIPGYRLLKHFEPVQVTDEERARDVWLINPETPTWAVHQELLRTGLVFDYRDGTPCYGASLEAIEDGQGVLIVEQSVETEADEFDLTDEGQYEWWATRVMASGVPPLTVIADSVTSILNNQTARTGQWTAAFKEFLKEADIPNALGVLHSPMGVNTDTPMQGLESMGQWDGMWYATAAKFPIQPHHRREFYTAPRLNDPRVQRSQIVMDDDGTLRMVPSDPSKKDEVANEGPPRRERLLAKLAKSGAPMWTKEVCGEGDDYAKDKKALEALASEGKVVKTEVQRGRTRGMTWSLPTALERGEETE